MTDDDKSKHSLICPQSRVELNKRFMGLGAHPRKAQRRITETVNAMVAQATKKGEAMSRRQARTILQKARGLR